MWRFYLICNSVQCNTKHQWMDKRCRCPYTVTLHLKVTMNLWSHFNSNRKQHQHLHGYYIILSLLDEHLSAINHTVIPSSIIKTEGWWWLVGFMTLHLPTPTRQVVLNPTTNGPKQAEFHRMVVPKNSQDTELKIKLAVRMDKPPNMKHSGWVCSFSSVKNKHTQSTENRKLPTVRKAETSQCAGRGRGFRNSSRAHVSKTPSISQISDATQPLSSLTVYSVDIDRKHGGEEGGDM